MCPCCRKKMQQMLLCTCGQTPTCSRKHVAPHTRLSKREEEVLGLFLRGFSCKTIGMRLVVCLHTVRSHLKTMYVKYGVHSPRTTTAVPIVARTARPIRPQVDATPSPTGMLITIVVVKSGWMTTKKTDVRSSKNMENLLSELQHDT